MCAPKCVCISFVTAYIDLYSLVDLIGGFNNFLELCLLTFYENFRKQLQIVHQKKLTYAG